MVEVRRWEVFPESTMLWAWFEPSVRAVVLMIKGSNLSAKMVKENMVTSIPAGTKVFRDTLYSGHTSSAQKMLADIPKRYHTNEYLFILVVTQQIGKMTEENAEEIIKHLEISTTWRTWVLY